MNKFTYFVAEGNEDTITDWIPLTFTKEFYCPLNKGDLFFGELVVYEVVKIIHESESYPVAICSIKVYL